VDRGYYSLETFTRLLTLKAKYDCCTCCLALLLLPPRPLCLLLIRTLTWVQPVSVIQPSTLDIARYWFSGTSTDSEAIARHRCEHFYQSVLTSWCHCKSPGPVIADTRTVLHCCVGITRPARSRRYTVSTVRYPRLSTSPTLGDCSFRCISNHPSSPSY